MRTTREYMKVVCMAFLLALSMEAQTDPHLLGWWKMDEEADATTLADASGNGRTLTAGSGCSIEAGKVGNALRFDGTTNAYASFTCPTLSNLTFAAWVRQDGMGDVAGNLYPKMFNLSSLYYRLSNTNYTSGASFCFDDPPTQAWNSDGVAPHSFFPERWTHVAVTYQSAYTSATDRVEWPTFYINGVRCGTTRVAQPWVSDRAGGIAIIGNESILGSRPVDGLLDEVQLYSAALSDKEIYALYLNRPPAVDAGAGQTCYRPETVLQGRLLNNSTFNSDRSAVTAWSVVDSPPGSTPVIDNPDVPATRVSLPVAGDYTFRLTAASGLGLGTVSNDVTITRAVGEAVDNDAPTVTTPWPSTNIVLSLGLPLTGTVSDDNKPTSTTRVCWSKVSGPGGVFFDNAFTNATTVFFSTNGTYVLRLEADDGAATGSAQVTATVALPTANLLDGLIHWWKFDDDPGVLKAYDSQGGNTLTALNGTLLQPGKTGYGLRSAKYNSDARLNDVYSTNAACMTLSMWLFQDDAYTNNAYMRLVDGTSISIVYRLPQRQLSMSIKGVDDVTYAWYQSGTVKLASNRWQHLTILLDRRAAETTGMTQTFYADGEKLNFGGLASVFPGAKDFEGIQHVGGNGSNRNFDGVIDDLRVYDRFLTEEEIKTLAVDPDSNRAPVIEVADTTLGTYAGKAITLPGVVYDDGQPAGGTLTVQWEVVSGDSSGLVFANPASASTALTPAKSGDYVLRLTASDGEQFSASDHVALKVSAKGTMVVIH